MNEFKENLQMIRESVDDANENNNPALISAEDRLKQELADEEQEASLENDEDEAPIPRRNEKGHRKRKSLRDKFDQLLFENRAKDNQLQQSMAYIQDQERRLAEAQAKAEQSNHYSNVYYENSLDNEKQRVITELEFAEESGDTRKKIELQDKLAEIAAQKQALLLSKSLPKQQPQEPSYIPYQEPVYQQHQDEPQQSINEHYEDWLDYHPWCDPQSADFDPDLHNEANEVAAELNKSLKFNGGGHIIGTPEYFNAISDEMNARYGVNRNSTHNTQRQSRNQRNQENYDYYAEDNQPSYEVGPVTTKGTSMADRYIANRQKSGNVARGMTIDQMEIAKSLAPVLSQINQKTTGKIVSEEEAAAIYLDMKRKQPWKS